MNLNKDAIRAIAEDRTAADVAAKRRWASEAAITVPAAILPRSTAGYGVPALFPNGERPMPAGDYEEHHARFLRQQHEKDLARSANDANAAAAELIAERIAAKLAEQNDIIYRMGQRQGRTSFIAYLSLIVGGAAALGQLLGPIWEWPVMQGLL